jgi:hypothetical protein
MTAQERRALIERNPNSFDVCGSPWIRSASRADYAPPGDWRPRQVAHHVADTELRSARLRLLLAEDDPLIGSGDEGQCAARLRYGQPVQASITLISAAMGTNLDLLAGLSEEDWLRAGRHEELGHFSVEGWLARAAAHGNEHASQSLGYVPTKD